MRQDWKKVQTLLHARQERALHGWPVPEVRDLWWAAGRRQTEDGVAVQAGLPGSRGGEREQDGHGGRADDISGRNVVNADEVLTRLGRHFNKCWHTFREVKDGPTWARHSGARRLDLVAIKKSWSPVTIAVVEVKVSHSDFINDTKWPSYLELGNEFYWACPKGLIKKTEVDKRCGLIHVGPTGARVVKKALYRDVPPDPMMLLYLLFWRMQSDDITERPETIRARIRQEMREKKELGHLYSHFVAPQLATANGRVNVHVPNPTSEARKGRGRG